ncbi:MAG: hypothetical protein AAB093_05630, partial [Nitrospirota bacterium]
MPSARSESLAGIIRLCESTGLPVTVLPSLARLIREGLQDGSRGEAWQGTPPTAPPEIQETWH